MFKKAKKESMVGVRALCVSAHLKKYVCVFISQDIIITSRCMTAQKYTLGCEYECLVLWVYVLGSYVCNLSHTNCATRQPTYTCIAYSH